MEFDHERYGIKAVVFATGDAEHESTYSIVLQLSTISMLSPEVVELTRGIPGEDTREVLLELQESCRRALKDLDANEAAQVQRPTS